MERDIQKLELWALRADVVDAAEARDWQKIQLDGDEMGGTAYKWDMRAREMDRETCRRVLAILR